MASIKPYFVSFVKTRSWLTVFISLLCIAMLSSEHLGSTMLMNLGELLGMAVGVNIREDNRW